MKEQFLRDFPGAVLKGYNDAMEEQSEQSTEQEVQAEELTGEEQSEESTEVEVQAGNVTGQEAVPGATEAQNTEGEEAEQQTGEGLGQRHTEQAVNSPPTVPQPEEEDAPAYRMGSQVSSR